MITLDLIHDLLEAADQDDVCPHLHAIVDSTTLPHCNSPDCPDSARQLATSHAALQLFCLAGPAQWSHCHLFTPPQHAS